MKCSLWITLTLLAIGLLGASPATAQASDTMAVNVTANVKGIFECTTNLAAFDFGDVDADAAAPSSTGVPGLGRNAGDNGGIYEALGAVTWTCRSAPGRDVDIALNSVAADHSGGMVDDDLEIQISGASPSGTSTGYQLFTSGTNLVTGVPTKNGANASTGNLDFRLNVLDDDPVGANTWVVNLLATGTP